MKPWGSHESPECAALHILRVTSVNGPIFLYSMTD
uniref:Uncharacterized protein n=1 Tax=Arundo donax TaxID=35708 RepID=A0A0A9QGA0_ARUDO